MKYFLLFTLLLSNSKSLHAGSFAGWFESVISGVKCGSLTNEDFSELESDCLICNQQKAELIIKQKTKDYSEIIEHLFFNRESEKHITQLDCQISTTKTLGKDQTQIKEIAKDIASKTAIIKELIKKITETHLQVIKQGEKVRDAGIVCNASTKTNHQECIAPLKAEKQKYDEFLNLFNGYKSLLAVTMASVWNGPTQSMQNFIKELVESKSPPTPENIALKLPKISENIIFELNDQKTNIQKSCVQYVNKVCNTYSLSEDQKREMFERSLESGTLKDLLDLKDSSAEKLYCRLNNKYIKGVDHLEKSFMIGGFALGGISALLPKIGLMMTGEEFLVVGSKITKAQNFFSLAGLASNLAFDYDYIHKQCFNDNNLNIAENACPADKLAIGKNEKQLHDARNCFLAATLMAAPSALIVSAPFLKAFSVESAAYLKTAAELKTLNARRILSHDALKITKGLNEMERPFPTMAAIEKSAKDSEEFYKRESIQVEVAQTTIDKPVSSIGNKTSNESIQKWRDLINKKETELKAMAKELRENIISIKVQGDELQAQLKPLLNQKAEEAHSIQEITKKLELEKKKSFNQRNHVFINGLETFLKEEKEKEKMLDAKILILSNESRKIERDLKTQTMHFESKGLDDAHIEETIKKSINRYQEQLSDELARLDRKMANQKRDLKFTSSVESRAKTDAEKFRLKVTKDKGLFNVYMLKEVPRAVKNPSLSTSFLLNPKFKDRYEKLKEMGVVIVLDSQLSSSANFVANTKSIHINPKFSFDLFEHEYTHALFNHYIAPILYSKNLSLKILNDEFKKGASLSDLVSPSGLKDIGETHILYLENLMKNYHKDITLDESLATQRQLASVGWRPLSPEFYHPKWYGAYHRTNELLDRIKNNSFSEEILKELETQMTQLSVNIRIYKGLSSVNNDLLKEFQTLSVAIKNGNAPMILSISNAIRHLAKPPEKDMANLFINDQGQIVKVNIDPYSGAESFELISSL